MALHIVSSIGSDVIGVLSLAAAPLSADEIHAQLPALPLKALKVQLTVLRGLGRVTFKPLPAGGGRWFVGSERIKGRAPLTPDFETAIAHPKRLRSAKLPQESWWIKPTDVEFTQAARDRATMMGWND